MRKVCGIITSLTFFLPGFYATNVQGTGIEPPLMVSVTASRATETTISEYGYADIVDSDTVTDFLHYNHTASASNGGIPSSNGSADQNSWINTATDSFHANGTAYGDAAWSGFTGGASVNSFSDFQYTFDVVSPADYLFTGSVSATRDVSNSLEAEVYADIYAQLYDVTNATYLHSFFQSSDGTHGFNYSGTLAAARYRVSVGSSVDLYSTYSEQFVAATANHSMNFQLAPAGTGISVPEPASGLILLFGLAPLLARFRRSPK